MGLFSNYRQRTTHPLHKQMLRKTIIAHQGEIITIDVEGGRGKIHGYSKHDNGFAEDRKPKERYNPHTGQYTEVFGHRVEYRAPRPSPKREAVSRHTVREISHISRELQRRRNAQPQTLSDYVDR